MGDSNYKKFPTGLLKLQQKDATKVIPIEIADNPILWSQGLTNRKDIPLEFGTLYIFPRITVVGFWMKNVHFPLNIAFINSKKEIINIQTMVPCTGKCPMYYSPKPFRYALETKSGFFEIFQFSKGCKISYKYD